MKEKYKNVLNFLNNAFAIALIFVYRKSKKARKYLQLLPSPRSLPMLRSLPSIGFMRSLPLPRANLIVFFGVIVILLGGLSLYFFFPGIGKSEDSKGTGKNVDIFKQIKKGKLVGTAKLGETISMGNLEITLYNTKEGSYTTFERDANNNRLSKTFFGANIKIFNTASGPSLENKEVVYTSLEDNLGNKYERDSEIEFMLGNIKDYGPDKNIWPRTIREGYLLFPGLPKEVESLDLIIYSDILKQKIIFDLAR